MKSRNSVAMVALGILCCATISCSPATTSPAQTSSAAQAVPQVDEVDGGAEREGGQEALRFFTEAKTVCLRYST